MSGSLNKVQLIGRLTRDPELRYTPQGVGVANFAVATDRFGRDEAGERTKSADFHDVVVFNGGQRKLADLCGQFLRKGSLVYVEGRLQTRSWESQAGEKKYRTEVIANEVQFLEPRSASAGEGMGESMSAPASAPVKAGVSQPVGGEGDLDPDDIPF